MEYYLLAPGLVGGDRKQAEAVAERIGRIDRGQGFLAQSRLAQFEHDLARQELLLRKAVEAAPSKYKVRIALAQFYTKERVNWEAAAENARAAIEIDPARVDGYSILAAAYAAQGNWADLEATLAAADRNVPDDLTPHFRAAEVDDSRRQKFRGRKGGSATSIWRRNRKATSRLLPMRARS